MLIWSDSEKEITEIPKIRKKFYENGKSTQDSRTAGQGTVLCL